TLLGRFLFSGWAEHEKPVSVLSGGERRRLALAVVVASGANFLVLDEPTNHLDLESREALEAALEAFPGTVLLVSHDRALLDAVADRLLAVEGKTIASYTGGWADYARAQEADVAPPPPPKPKRERPARPAKPKPSVLEQAHVADGVQEDAGPRERPRDGRADRGRGGDRLVPRSGVVVLALPAALREALDRLHGDAAPLAFVEQLLEALAVPRVLLLR